MIRRTNIELQKLMRVRFFDCLSSCFVILVVSLLFYLVPAISPVYTARLHQAQAQTRTTAATKIRVNSFLIYDNNSTLGIKIQYPVNWERLEYDDEGVLFLSPSESNSDKFLESFSIRVTPSNNTSLSELAKESIDNYGQQFIHFQLIGSKAITFYGKSAYLLNYTFTDKLYGKGMGVDIGTTTGNKAYVLTYLQNQQNSLIICQ
jgi:hypothetical protein